MKISASLEQNKKQAYEIFPVGKSFDLITRDLYLGKSRAWFLGINGICKIPYLPIMNPFSLFLCTWLPKSVMPRQN